MPMSDNLKIEISNDLLIISDAGIRKNLTSAIQGTEMIAAAAEKYNKQVVLVDYRKVHYEVPLTDAYNLVKVFEHKVPVYKDLLMAVVVDQQDWELAKFWESISVKRGYSFKLFDDIKEAKDWLKNTRSPVSK